MSAETIPNPSTVADHFPKIMFFDTHAHSFFYKGIRVDFRSNYLHMLLPKWILKSISLGLGVLDHVFLLRFPAVYRYTAHERGTATSTTNQRPVCGPWADHGVIFFDFLGGDF